MVPTRRTIGRVAAIGLLAFLMSACLKLDMNLEVSSNNTVSGTVIFAVQKELLELSGGSVEDILGTDAPLPSDVPGVSVQEYEDDEFAGQQFTFDAVPLEQFNTDDPDALNIVREGDVFTVTGVLDMSSGLSGATGATGFTGLDPEQFLQGAQLEIKITFPGEVTETNGEVDGTTVTWVPQVGERLELRATASAIGSGSGGGIGGGGDGDSNLTLLLIIGGAVVVVAIVIGVVVSQRRGKAAAAAAGAGLGTVGAPPPGAAPTPPPSSPPAPPPPPPPGPPDQP